ncbi:hypothetical protein RN001_009545 [Aquatica leii]|uniref:BESS domain-containing protein n=1 Tax=Aquatica leii TaxID=1421715 RepID=A0AAN7PTV8_9COLE|nr:hypothetical protein RN001_009545 [Aquatica leii]
MWSQKRDMLIKVRDPNTITDDKLRMFLYNGDDVNFDEEFENVNEVEEFSDDKTEIILKIDELLDIEEENATSYEILLLENMSKLSCKDVYEANRTLTNEELLDIININFDFLLDNSPDTDAESDHKNIEPRAPNKRLKRINNDDKFFNLWKERDEKRQTLLKTIVKRKDDDVELFCSHIAEVLRSLPSVNKAEAKKHLGIVLSNYEIMAARTTSSATSTNTVCSDIDILSPTPHSSSLSSYDLSVPYASPLSEHADRSTDFSIAEHHTSNAYSSVSTGSPQPTDLVFLESQEQVYLDM